MSDTLSRTPAATPERVPMLASLKRFNYRLFWLGALTSNVGGWMARVAQDWLVLTELTHGSAAALGIVTALQFAPIPLLTPFAGALADRFEKRRLLMVAQTGLASVAFVLWALVASGRVELWHVYLLAALTGVASAFEMPVRQAFVSEMVPNRLVPNAIGLNSAQFNSARLVGPGLAGLLIAAFGVAPALLVNALSFAGSIAALHFMRRDELIPSPRGTAKRGVRAGFAYVRGRPDIVLILVVVGSFATFGMNFQITNALMATQVFGRGAGAYGLLGSVMAVGTLAAAMVAARRARPRLRVLLAAMAAFSVLTLVAALSTSYVMFAVLLVPIGMAALTVMTSCNATVQLAAEPEFRGRVMAVYMAVNMGGTPIGAPILGWLAEVWGPRSPLLIGSAMTGLTFVAVSAWVMVHDGLRLRLRRSWPPLLVVAASDEPAPR